MTTAQYLQWLVPTGLLILGTMSHVQLEAIAKQIGWRVREWRVGALEAFFGCAGLVGWCLIHRQTISGMGQPVIGLAMYAYMGASLAGVAPMLSLCLMWIGLVRSFVFDMDDGVSV